MSTVATTPNPVPPGVDEGSRPSGSDADRILPDGLSMGAPTLRVGDLPAMSGYYSGAFAMEPLAERDTPAGPVRVLGRRGVPLVRLVATPDLPRPGRHEAGLFHTAFVLDSPADLAATVHRAARYPGTRFTGAADHLVSEAFYFTDPEGNGVELYTDRDRSLWHYQAGQVVVGTERLDPADYLRRHLGDAGTDPGAVGHVHLQVGDIDTARGFYVDALGFAVTGDRYPGALFAAVGGYHHHLAVNTWNSRGAGPRAAALGLGEVAVTVPARTDLEALVHRLRERGLPFRDDGRTLRVQDPWGTRITVATPEGGVAEMLEH